MKLKTSITLSEDIVKMVGKAGKKDESRSEVIERLLRDAFAAQQRSEADSRDLELLNRYADELNRQAEDVLDYQEGLNEKG